MTESSDKLDRLLRQSYPAVEVSSDFTLRLWRKLMKQRGEQFWRIVPRPALVAAAVLGMVAAFYTISSRSVQVLPERLDLFGNAPYDSVSGSVLSVLEGGTLG